MLAIPSTRPHPSRSFTGSSSQGSKRGSVRDCSMPPLRPRQLIEMLAPIGPTPPASLLGCSLPGMEGTRPATTPRCVGVSRLRKEVTSGSNRTPGAATGAETWGSLPTRIAESVVNVPDRDVLFWFGWAEPAPIETLAERSRAAIDEFTRLEAGWDGCDGVAVLPAAARHALCLLEAIGRHTTFRPGVTPLEREAATGMVGRHP